MNSPGAEVGQYLTSDFAARPYWWDRSRLSGNPSPDPAEIDSRLEQLPAAVDVVVIGAGYTGLCAALELARAGRATLVLDARQPGFGCSTRNGGQISSSIKPGFEELSKQYGPDLAAQIIGDGHEALRWIGEFIADEQINCDYRVSGRFYGAHSRRAFENIATKSDDQPPGVTLDTDIVPQSEQHAYIGSDVYFGGIVYHRHSSLDPGAYHAGLLERVLAAGATVVGHAKVTSLEKDGGQFTVGVGRHRVKAGHVVMATNGYSDNLVPWLRRRVIPIGSYIIATEPLEQGVMSRLIPEQRVVTDSRQLVVYYRPSPDNTRMLFGARVSITESDAVKAVPALHKEMSWRFPELGNVKISHAWMGFVAYTFDSMPHLGSHDGIHYAMGYCGSGVSLSSFSGTRIARQLLGTEDVPAAFSQTRFDGRFYYRQKPWFLAPSLAWYRLQDARS